MYNLTNFGLSLLLTTPWSGWHYPKYGRHMVSRLSIPLQNFSIYNFFVWLFVIATLNDMDTNEWEVSNLFFQWYEMLDKSEIWCFIQMLKPVMVQKIESRFRVLYWL